MISHNWKEKIVLNRHWFSLGSLFKVKIMLSVSWSFLHVHLNFKKQTSKYEVFWNAALTDNQQGVGRQPAPNLVICQSLGRQLSRVPKTATKPILYSIPLQSLIPNSCPAGPPHPASQPCVWSDIYHMPVLGTSACQLSGWRRASILVPYIDKVPGCWECAPLVSPFPPLHFRHPVAATPGSIGDDNDEDVDDGAIRTRDTGFLGSATIVNCILIWWTCGKIANQLYLHGHV